MKTLHITVNILPSSWRYFDRILNSSFINFLVLYTYISSVQSLSRVPLFATPWITAHQASLSSPTPTVYSNSYPLCRWCYPTISSSVVPFSSCPQSLPASGSFPVSQLFPWGGQNTGVSASASVLPMNTQNWSPLGWAGWISLQSKGLSRVFSTTSSKASFFQHSAFFTCIVVNPIYPITLQYYWFLTRDKFVYTFSEN